MPEKTLKESTFAKASVDEKVERAKVTAEEMTEFCLNEYMRAVELSDRGTWQMRHADCEEVQEALTALEEELQHAREALSWIPVTERLPEKHNFYEVTVDNAGNRHVEVLVWEDGWYFFFPNGAHWFLASQDEELNGNIIAWREPSNPYTPEETEK